MTKMVNLYDPNRVWSGQKSEENPGSEERGAMGYLSKLFWVKFKLGDLYDKIIDFLLTMPNFFKGKYSKYSCTRSKKSTFLQWQFFCEY